MANNIDLLSITTPLGADAFVLVGVNGRAALSRCFRYALFLRAGSKQLDANQLLDKSVTVTIAGEGLNQTYINGIVSAVIQRPGNVVGSDLSGGLEAWEYELTIVPKLWFLEQTSDCRIFQNKTGLDIVKEILGEFGITDFKTSGESGATYDYTVMFNESYLAFVERILARDGLFYCFEHADGKHTLAITDGTQPYTSLGSFKFAGLTATEIGVHTIQRADTTAIGSFMRNDYHYEQATTKLSGDAKTILKASAASDRKYYSFPSENPVKGDIDDLVRHQNEAAEVRAQLFAGGGNAPQLLAPGFGFTLEGDPFATSDFVIAEASISVSDDAGGGGGGGAGVEVSFTAFAKSVKWRPALLPKPVVPGLQSAVVAGRSGEELYTDKYGRVKVQFNWDTRGKKDENSSCWLRVLQPWAGKGWGFQFLPRIGQEVAVTFLESDIDRPVVIGSFYNSDQPELFALPGSQNKAGFRSRSTKKGGTSNYSEFSIDDTKGSEVVLLHAEKDYTIEVENDETRSVGNDRTVTVKKDETITVDGNQKETVKGNRTFEVQGDHSETVDGDQQVKVAGDQEVTVSGNQTVKVSGNHTEDVIGNQKVSVDGSQTIKAMGAVTYESMDSITLKVGGNSIKIDNTGVTITGTMVKLNAETMLKTSALMSQHAASGMLKLTGGIIMVN